MFAHTHTGMIKSIVCTLQHEINNGLCCNVRLQSISAVCFEMFLQVEKNRRTYFHRCAALNTPRALGALCRTFHDAIKLPFLDAGSSHSARCLLVPFIIFALFAGGHGLAREELAILGFEPTERL